MPTQGSCSKDAGSHAGASSTSSAYTPHLTQCGQLVGDLHTCHVCDHAQIRMQLALLSVIIPSDGEGVVTFLFWEPVSWHWEASVCFDVSLL